MYTFKKGRIIAKKSLEKREKEGKAGRLAGHLEGLIKTKGCRLLK